MVKTSMLICGTSINTTGSWSGEIWNKNQNGDLYPEYLYRYNLNTKW